MTARISAPAANAAAIELVRQDAIRERDAKIGSWFRNIFRAIAEFPSRRRVMDELSSLSDRELADIGLSRADIPRVFDLPADRPSATVYTLPVADKSAANDQVEVRIQSSRIAA